MIAKIISGLILILALAVSGGYAQELTLTATAANTVSSKSTIDVPALNGNLQAVIIATPVGSTATLNPHPIGAWYYNGKWNIFNSDNAVMPLGAKYLVQYFPQPDTNHFVHIIPQAGSGTVARTYLDHPALDYKPNAQVKILQNHAPDYRPYYLNQSEAQVSYENGKWFIQNVNGTALNPKTAYNVVISQAATTGSPIDTTNLNPTGKTSTVFSPSGNAGGDLSGSYPDPTVQKLLGRPLSNTPPSVGQILKWNGTAWEPANETGGGGGGSSSSSSGKTYSAGLGLELEGTTFKALNTTAMWNASQLAGRDIMTTAPTSGQVLKWTGTVWAPAADDNAGSTAGAANSVTQTFFKNTSETSPSLDKNGVYVFANHTYPITVTKNSRLIISGNFSLSSDGCFGCSTTKLAVDLMVNNVPNSTLSRVEIANGAYTTTSVSNFMLDIAPGTYTIQFRVTHSWIDGNIAGRGTALFSSIIVLPQ